MSKRIEPLRLRSDAYHLPVDLAVWRIKEGTGCGWRARLTVGGVTVERKGPDLARFLRPMLVEALREWDARRPTT